MCWTLQSVVGPSQELLSLASSKGLFQLQTMLAKTVSATQEIAVDWKKEAVNAILLLNLL